jgi:hypothetical protein
MLADRRISTLLAVLVFAAAIAVPEALASRATTPQPLPTLYVQYTNQCTFTVVNDAGQQVTSIAPGHYELDVSTPIMFKLLVPGGPTSSPVAANDFLGCKGWVQFQMTGPGVNAYTTLDSGCSSDLVLGTWTLQPSSTYTLEDMNQPAATKMTITTLANGTPILPTKTPYDTTSGKGTLSTDLVGSSALRGTVQGKLTANGALTLTLKGKAVSKLHSGRYTFTIFDQDPRGGVSLEANARNAKATPLSGSAFVGIKKTTVQLSAGRWTISTPGGHSYTLAVS